MKLDELHGKKIVIVGYGVEGKSVESVLKNTFPDMIVAVVDKSNGPHYLDKLKDYDLAIKSPGVNKSLMTIPYTTATNLFFANIKNTVIGVTGTKGKSTTASLIHHILKDAGKKSHLVGNIGIPAFDLLAKPLGGDDIVVMELSSYQLDDIAYSPHIAVITSIFPEHMDYHGSIDDYYNAKKNIIAYSCSHDVVIYNSKYAPIRQWVDSISCKKKDVNGLKLEGVVTELLGKHNRENILLAYEAAKEMGISDEQIIKAIASFKPLPHRLEKVGIFNGICFYNDAISTTPESTIAALDTLQSVDTLFLGGQDRGYDFLQLVDSIIKHKVSNIVLFSDSGAKIYSLLKNQNMTRVNILQTNDMKEAVQFAFQKTKKGAICLLSTASPSYSLWKNYVEKGNFFKKCILSYEKN